MNIIYHGCRPSRLNINSFNNKWVIKMIQEAINKNCCKYSAFRIRIIYIVIIIEFGINYNSLLSKIFFKFFTLKISEYSK